MNETQENVEQVETTDPGQVENTNSETEMDSSKPLEVIIIDSEIKSVTTEIVTGNGTIQVIHEITLGEIVSSTLMITILFFLIIDRFIRR